MVAFWYNGICLWSETTIDGKVKILNFLWNNDGLHMIDDTCPSQLDAFAVAAIMPFKLNGFLLIHRSGEFFWTSTWNLIVCCDETCLSNHDWNLVLYWSNIVAVYFFPEILVQALWFVSVFINQWMFDDNSNQKTT